VYTLTVNEINRQYFIIEKGLKHIIKSVQKFTLWTMDLLTNWRWLISSFKPIEYFRILLYQGCTTQISWRATNFFPLSKGQSWYVVTRSKSVFIKEGSKINKMWGFAGQIKSFRGPYVVHACSILTLSSRYK